MDEQLVIAAPKHVKTTVEEGGALFYDRLFKSVAASKRPQGPRTGDLTQEIRLKFVLARNPRTLGN